MEDRIGDIITTLEEIKKVQVTFAKALQVLLMETEYSQDATATAGVVVVKELNAFASANTSRIITPNNTPGIS